jgi:hypothetical protein
VGKGKGCLVEDNVAGNDDPVSGEVKTPVALVIRWITKESTESRARGKLVRSGGRKVGIAGAPKRSKIMIGGEAAMEGEERGAHV